MSFLIVFVFMPIVLGAIVGTYLALRGEGLDVSGLGALLRRADRTPGESRSDR